MEGDLFSLLFPFNQTLPNQTNEKDRSFDG